MIGDRKETREKQIDEICISFEDAVSLLDMSKSYVSEYHVGEFGDNETIQNERAELDIIERLQSKLGI